MVTIVYSDDFLSSSKKLPAPQQKKLAGLLVLMTENPFHHLLHTKSLTGPLSGLYAFRITRDWGVMFQFLSPDSVQLLDVGHRREIYQ